MNGESQNPTHTAGRHRRPNAALFQKRTTRYARRPARRELSALVDDFWLQQAPADAQPAPATVLAAGPSVDLVINFADAFELLEGEAGTPLPAIHLVGPRSRSVCVRATGRTGLVIARLHPWAAVALTGGSPDRLADRFIAAGDLGWGTEAATIVERIALASSAATRVDLAARWLAGLLHGRRPDELVVTAVRRINAAAGNVRVTELACALGISERQLRRRFRAAVGLGPKRVARVLRFQRAVGLLRAGRSWADVLEVCDFFDQAHLIGELRAMAGMTPPTIQRGTSTRLGDYFNSCDLSKLCGTAYL